MNHLKQSFGIDDTFTKLYRKPTRADEMTKVKDQIPLIPNYNQMADILHLPTDKFGFNKLLVIVDIATDNFDIEKMKGETAPETLSAYYKILNRGILKLPYASLLSDGGSSFKGSFNNFLWKNGIDHRVARPGRHHQLSCVDSLCRQLGEIFNGIMNKKEEETGKTSKAWTHAIDEVREKLNEYRRKRGVKIPTDITEYNYPIFDNLELPKTKRKKEKPMRGGDLDSDIANAHIDTYPTDGKKYKQIKNKYKVGDMVNVLFEEPQTILGVKQPTKQFRMGDLRLSKKKYQVLKVLYYSAPNHFRYLLQGLPNASYTERELRQV